jgi:hypothetical protein
MAAGKTKEPMEQRRIYEKVSAFAKMSRRHAGAPRNPAKQKYNRYGLILSNLLWSRTVRFVPN